MAARKELTDDLPLGARARRQRRLDHAGPVPAQDLRVSHKPDLTEVTDADHRRRGGDPPHAGQQPAARRRPRRRGEDTGWGPRRWVIDPIDGTANFVRGVPAWATLIALMVEDKVEVGVVSRPPAGPPVVGVHGRWLLHRKSLMNATPMRVSNVSSLSDAFLSYSSLKGWVDAERGLQFGDLMRTVWRDSCRSATSGRTLLVGEGAVDISVEPETGATTWRRST